jgi:DNA (cytosine-5)-methyltransferase 1
MSRLSSIEVCAGAGGQLLGLEQAGFAHEAAVEIDHWACETLRRNTPAGCNVVEQDLKDFPASTYRGVDLYAGGLPCPPFSIAGKQLGESDERNLFGIAIQQIAECRPKAVMIENVKGILDPSFASYRAWIESSLTKQAFKVRWLRVNAADFGVPQLRPRVVLVALKEPFASHFTAPAASGAAPTVGDEIHDLMAANGWAGASLWRGRANRIAPTIVGGSKKHGGPDLGPTRARKAWAELGVDGLTVANEAPGPDFPVDANPKLTVRMVARLQGFPDHWEFAGKKTHAYRQVGNAFPPPVAKAVARQIALALGQAVANPLAMAAE